MFLAYENQKARIGKVTRANGGAPQALRRPLGNEAELGLEPPVFVMSQARIWTLASSGQVLVPAMPGGAQTPVTLPEERSTPAAGYLQLYGRDRSWGCLPQTAHRDALLTHGGFVTWACPQASDRKHSCVCASTEEEESYSGNQIDARCKKLRGADL